MFKNIGIYVKEKKDDFIDSHGLDALILSLKKHTPSIFIEEKITKLKNVKCPSTCSIFEPITYIHKQLKTKWVKEK